MRKLLWLLGSLTALLGNPAFAEVTWNAGAGYRTVTQRSDDGLGTKDFQGKGASQSTRRGWEYRATLGPSGTGEILDWGVAIRTHPTGSVNTEWVSSLNNTDALLGLGEVYVRPHGVLPGGNWAITIGRQRNAILFDNVAQALYGNPVRWDGLGWNLNYGNFGLNLAQYAFGAANGGVSGASSYSFTDASQSVANAQSHFSILYAFQPYVKIHFSEEILSTLAIGYYSWSGTGAGDGNGFFSNAIHGGTAGTVGNTSPVVMDNPRQWHLLSDTELPYRFRFIGEVVRNKAVVYGTRVMAASPLVYADRTTFALSLVLGRPEKAGDLSFQYSYVNKGVGSVASPLTNVDIPADNISHMFELRYLPADALTIAARLQYHREKANLGGDGQPVQIPYNGRQQTQRRIELNAQVQI